MSNISRYFVEIEAPGRRALVDLGKLGLDLFRHSTVTVASNVRAAAATNAPVNMTIEGLLDMNQVEKLVKAGYVVTVKEEASRHTSAARNVIDFEQWLKEMKEE